MDWGAVESKEELQGEDLQNNSIWHFFFKLHELEGNFQKNFLPYKLNPFSPPSVPLLLTKSSS